MDANNKWHNAIRRYFPDAESSLIDELLWIATPFPVGDSTAIMDEVKRLAAATNGSITTALKLATEEQEQEWYQYKQMCLAKER